MEHNSLSLGQFWSLFLDSCIQKVELYTVRARIDDFARLQQLIMDYSLPVPPNTLNSLVCRKSRFEIVCGGSLAFDHDCLHLIFSYFTHILTPVKIRFKNSSISLHFSSISLMVIRSNKFLCANACGTQTTSSFLKPVLFK